MVFRGEGSGAQSSLTEYRGDYRKLTASKKGSVLSLKTFGGDQVNFLATQLKSPTPSAPRPSLLNNDRFLITKKNLTGRDWNEMGRVLTFDAFVLSTFAITRSYVRALDAPRAMKDVLSDLSTSPKEEMFSLHC